MRRLIKMYLSRFSVVRRACNECVLFDLCTNCGCGAKVSLTIHTLIRIVCSRQMENGVSRVPIYKKHMHLHSVRGTVKVILFRIALREIDKTQLGLPCECESAAESSPCCMEHGKVNNLFVFMFASGAAERVSRKNRSLGMKF